MGIYTGGMRQQQEATAEANRLAKKQAKAEKKEKKRKGWSNVLGTIGGALAGAAAVGLTGLTGGLAAPLVMGAATSLSKKWIDEGTKNIGMGADPSKIQTTGKYGYGGSKAASIRKGLKESRKTDWSAKTMLGDIASSYVTAGFSGGLGAGKEALKAGNVGAAIKGTGVGGMEGLKQSMAGLIPGGEDAADFTFDPTTESIVSSSAAPISDVYSPLHDPSLSENIIEGEGYQGFPFEQEEFGPQLPDDQPLLGPFQEGGEGGQVLNQEELLGLLILEEMQNQKAYDNTPLEEAQQPTISEYFGSENKTLGGSSTKSIAQLLGR